MIFNSGHKLHTANYSIIHYCGIVVKNILFYFTPSIWQQIVTSVKKGVNNLNGRANFFLKFVCFQRLLLFRFTTND